MKHWKFILLFISLFIFRSLFGMSLNFTGGGEIDHDSLQTFLIGLKCYTTDTWPYFGPDKYQAEIHFQVPGALEGLAIALPFYVLPVPEAPFLFLNLLSLSAIALLSWYITRRLTELSLYFVFTWVSLLPWTLNFSTHVFNISYLLFGSVLFLVGFLEGFPPLSLKKVPATWSFGLMGFGLFWDMQFHSSWVLLLPFGLAALLFQLKANPKVWWRISGAFFVGALLPLACLMPTLLKYGFGQGVTGIQGMLVFFYRENILSFFTILARYLSLACFEVPRFLGPHTSDRLAFLKAVPWIWPPVVFLTLLGWLQPFALLVAGWIPDKRHPEGLRIQLLAFLTLFWIWFCFWFTTNGPAAHMYYLFLPLVVLCYFYLWVRLVPYKGWRIFGGVCLMASLWLHTGILVQKAKGESFFYNRAKVAQALEKKDYHILAERRPWVLY